MNKPTKKVIKEPMLNYLEMIEYIEKKYKIKTRSYHEIYSKKKDDWLTYMDFWHWLCDVTELRNDSEIYLSVEEWLEDDEVKPWIKEILNLIKKEFGEHFDKDGGLEVWVSW